MKGGHDQVSCEACLDADGERFRVSHFSNHHHIWVLAEEGAHYAWERHFLRDLYLGDVVLELIFDRVLDGDNIPLYPVELVYRSVKCGCFAGAGWTRDYDHAVRSLYRLEPLALHVSGHPQNADVYAHAGWIEEPGYHL